MGVVVVEGDQLVVGSRRWGIRQWTKTRHGKKGLVSASVRVHDRLTCSLCSPLSQSLSLILYLSVGLSFAPLSLPRILDSTSLPFVLLSRANT